jgi:hypothetical protein
MVGMGAVKCGYHIVHSSHRRQTSGEVRGSYHRLKGGWRGVRASNYCSTLDDLLMARKGAQ